MIKLVIFDCDGVIVDSELIGNRVGAEVKTRFGVPMDTEEHMRRFVGCSPKDPVYSDLLKQIPAEKHQEFFKATIEDRDHAFKNELALNSGVKDALADLSNLGISYCIASNGTYQKMGVTLSLTGVDSNFKDKVYSSELVENGKPAPDLFLYASKAMGFTPQECLVVEDSPKGIEAAKAAGMRVLGYSGGSHFKFRFMHEKLASAAPNSVYNDMSTLSQEITKLGL